MNNIRFGHRDMPFPNAHIGEIVDSSDLLDDIPALKARMAKDGYLLLRGLIDRDKVIKARETVFAHLDEHNALVPNTPLLEGVMGDGSRRSPQMMGNKGIQHHDDVLAVIEGEELFNFYERYFNEPAITYDFKWLRAVGNEEYTGAHMDYVYMGRGSEKLHTTWIPFGDIPIEQGTLVMCVGSNHLDSFSKIRDTYGRLDVDRDMVEGWFTKEPMELTDDFGGTWVGGDFGAGDVILFGMHTMHASTTNLTHNWRLSCDVRFQPASEPVDERWRKNGIGHTSKEAVVRPMEEARAEWGV